MNICKRALTIALRHPLYLIIYICFLSSMGVVLMGEVGGSGTQEATEVPRARIALVDRDGSAVSQSLEEMLSCLLYTSRHPTGRCPLAAIKAAGPQSHRNRETDDVSPGRSACRTSP